MLEVPHWGVSSSSLIEDEFLTELDVLSKFQPSSTAQSREISKSQSGLGLVWVWSQFRSNVWLRLSQPTNSVQSADTTKHVDLANIMQFRETVTQKEECADNEAMMQDTKSANLENSEMKIKVDLQENEKPKKSKKANQKSKKPISDKK